MKQILIAIFVMCLLIAVLIQLAQRAQMTEDKRDFLKSCHAEGNAMRECEFLYKFIQETTRS